jgi:hypothetical protein
MHYFSFSEPELALVFSRQGIPAQVYCALQIGYFKAKHAFFLFSWEDVEGDCAFILPRYFNGQALVPPSITKHEYYAQRNAIVALFGFRLWSAEFLPHLCSVTIRN